MRMMISIVSAALQAALCPDPHSAAKALAQLRLVPLPMDPSHSRSDLCILLSW